MSTSTVPCLVPRSYFSSARGVWQTATMLPSLSAARPLQPLPAMKTSHLSVAGLYLIMSPGPGCMMVKFEKKNAFWLATQVGPSFQLYVTVKPGQMLLEAPGLGASKGPAGQRAGAAIDPLSGGEAT